MSFLKSVIATICVLFTAISSVMPWVEPTFEPIDAENVKMSAVLTADLHTDGNPFRDRNDNLRRSFSNIKNCTRDYDAIVMAGDLTNSASANEYFILRTMVQTYLKDENIIPQMGNHDSRGTNVNKDFELATKYFQMFCKFYGKNTKTNYYSTIVNGYKFIVMGTEKLLQNQAYFSDIQLKWLDIELADASKSDNPVFIVCHQPINGTYGSNSLGDSSDKFVETIKKYTDNGMTALLISGHCHQPMSVENLKNFGGGLYQINLPTFLFSDDNGGDCETGAAYVMECYEDKIILRARDFSADELYKDIEFTINL